MSFQNINPNVVMVEFTKLIGGIHPMDMVALFDHNDTPTNLNEAVQLSDMTYDPKIIVMPKEQFETVFRSMLHKNKTKGSETMNTKTILVFAFQTGDESCKTYEVFAVLNNDAVHPDQIEKGLTALREELENSGTDDLSYEEIVEKLLNSYTDLSWSELTIPINNVGRIRLIMA